MKNKIIMTMGAITLTVALVAGISYAWFTARASTEPTSVGAGYLNISLTGNPGGSEVIFPAEEGKTIEYTITNNSSREVVAQFRKGALTAYVMPESYLDSDGFISKENHEIMINLSADQKMKVNGGTSDFVRLDTVPAAHVTSDIAGNWTLTGTGSAYLGKDEDGNQYFRLPIAGTATATFCVALTAEADNRYQYALFTLGEATALATQNNDTAVKTVFGVDDIAGLTE